jgi:transketolase
MTNAERIIAISKKLDLSHIGSNLSCLPVLEEIYAKKEPEDIVILDNAHAGLAHLVVQDWYDAKQGMVIAPYEGMRTREDLFKEYGIHCDRKAGCDASGGSLGHGLGIGIGYALADRKRDVYVIVSEGSCMEGSFWESLRLAQSFSLKNLHILTNFNGYSAVAEIDNLPIRLAMVALAPDLDIGMRFTKNTEPYEGVQGHYRKAA